VRFRRLSWIAASWLCCQLAVLTSAPVSLLAANHTAATPACTCTHTGHDQCPMHHPKSKDGCECRSTTQPGDATLVSLLGPIAVMPHAIASVAAPPSTRLPNYSITGFTDAVALPDGPPPRA